MAVLEGEFRLLIAQLTLNPDSLDLLVELALRSEHGDGMAAIAKCGRRIAAAKAVYLDGDMTREEYLKIKKGEGWRFGWDSEEAPRFSALFIGLPLR